MSQAEDTRGRAQVRRRPSGRARCPFCRDRIEADPVRCGRCGAIHHLDCAWEHPGCSACGEDLDDEVRRVALERSERRPAGLLGWLRGREEGRLRAGEWRRFHGSLLVVSGVTSAFLLFGLWLVLRTVFQDVV